MKQKTKREEAKALLTQLIADKGTAQGIPTVVGDKTITVPLSRLDLIRTVAALEFYAATLPKTKDGSPPSRAMQELAKDYAALARQLNLHFPPLAKTYTAWVKGDVEWVAEAK